MSAEIPPTLTCRVNGELLSLPAGTTLADLLRERGWAGKRVAVERNGEIVPRSLYAQTAIAEGDAIEVVVAVGGG
ncbi:sulfur carrier protein ThiS [Tepidiphilus margaritifer]|uniref:sulfur carrier protein ThiS n=1 Tax=Tepidiphilus margaritifer TaxID=203471 RepID=UPI00068556E8|nr:sulfur carrier protein ThiS [Tepidiphilus margaritifer]